MMAGATVIGRGSELGQITRFLDGVPEQPSALLLAGEAGIGKTTLWEWAIDGASARAWHVLQTRANASETTMTFAALGDLLEPVIDDVIGELPDMQRSPLDAALLRAERGDSMPDQRAVSLAFLGCLRAVARSSPVLIAIDDVQWLDAPSANVLRFVIRRLKDEPVGILASLRLGEANGDRLELNRALPGARARRLVVGSMSSEDLGRLIRERLEAELPHPVTERVHDAAGGNPFFAIEIARELVNRGIPEAGEALPIPDDVREVLKARLSTLPELARTVLLTAAATSRPTEPLVAVSSGLGERADAALTQAIDAGVVSLEGERIRFMHPLFASTVYTSASLNRRRDSHRRLAAQVKDAEERARHLALASPGPDAGVASALDDAAVIAGARGAPQSAAELSELARRLTPPSDVRDSIRRTEQAAVHLFDAGDDAGARVLLEDAIAAAVPGDEQARLLYRLASVSWMDMHRVSELCERALGQSADDP
jgi:AAA ATPase domain